MTVGGRLDGGRLIGVGRTTVRRVVLEAPVGRRVVGRRHDDAVRAPLRPGARAVVDDHGVRDDRRRDRYQPWYAKRGAAGAGHDHPHVVGCEYLDGGEQRGFRERVRVGAEEQGPGDAAVPAVIGDRLTDRRDVVLVEGLRYRRAPVSRGAEAHRLRGISSVRAQHVVSRDEARDVDEEAAWRRLTGQGMRAHGRTSDCAITLLPAREGPASGGERS